MVGEIQDEFDEKGDEITKTEDVNFIVDGKFILEDINELLKITKESEKIDHKYFFDFVYQYIILISIHFLITF